MSFAQKFVVVLLAGFVTVLALSGLVFFLAQKRAASDNSERPYHRESLSSVERKWRSTDVGSFINSPENLERSGDLGNTSAYWRALEYRTVHNIPPGKDELLTSLSLSRRLRDNPDMKSLRQRVRLIWSADRIVKLSLRQGAPERVLVAFSRSDLCPYGKGHEVLFKEYESIKKMPSIDRSTRSAVLEELTNELSRDEKEKERIPLLLELIQLHSDEHGRISDSVLRDRTQLVQAYIALNNLPEARKEFLEAFRMHTAATDSNISRNLLHDAYFGLLNSYVSYLAKHPDKDARAELKEILRRDFPARIKELKPHNDLFVACMAMEIFSQSGFDDLAEIPRQYVLDEKPASMSTLENGAGTFESLIWRLSEQNDKKLLPQVIGWFDVNLPETPGFKEQDESAGKLIVSVARAETKLGRLASAKKRLEILQSHFSPDDEDLKYSICSALCDVAVKSGNVADALKLAQECRDREIVDDDTCESYIDVGRGLNRLKQYDACAKYLEYGLGKDELPTSAQLKLRLALAKTYVKMGKTEKAANLAKFVLSEEVTNERRDPYMNTQDFPELALFLPENDAKIAFVNGLRRECNSGVLNHVQALHVQFYLLNKNPGDKVLAADIVESLKEVASGDYTYESLSQLRKEELAQALILTRKAGDEKLSSKISKSIVDWKEE